MLGTVLLVVINLFVKNDMYAAGINSVLIGYIFNSYVSFRKSREDKENNLNEKIFSNEYEKLEILPTLVNNLLKSAVEIKTMLIFIDVKVDSNKLNNLENEDLNQISKYLLGNFDKITHFL